MRLSTTAHTKYPCHLHQQRTYPACCQRAKQYQHVVTTLAAFALQVRLIHTDNPRMNRTRPTKTAATNSSRRLSYSSFIGGLSYSVESQDLHLLHCLTPHGDTITHYHDQQRGLASYHSQRDAIRCERPLSSIPVTQARDSICFLVCFRRWNMWYSANRTSRGTPALLAVIERVGTYNAPTFNYQYMLLGVGLSSGLSDFEAKLNFYCVRARDAFAGYHT